MVSKRLLIILVSVNLGLLAAVCVLLSARPTPPAPVALKAASASARPVPVADFPLAEARRVTPSPAAQDPLPLAQQPPTPAPEESSTTDGIWPNPNLVPIAFTDPDESDPMWTPEALDRLRNLREQFSQAAQPLRNMDQNTPEYFARWTAIQNEFDQQYRLHFGAEAYLRYERQQRMINNQGIDP